jgi:uncharacterized delta-60 repeat protein
MKQVLSLIFTLCISIAAIAQPCSLDNTFDTDGRVLGDYNRIGDRVLALPNGEALVAHNAFGNGSAYIKKYLNNGSVDNTWGSTGTCAISAASSGTEIRYMLLHNNKVYISGNTYTGSSTYAYVACINLNGTLDNTFGNNGIKHLYQDYNVEKMCVQQSSGKIILGGLRDYDELMVCRINANGNVDASFGASGYATITTSTSNTYFDLYDLIIDNTGNLVATGRHHSTSGTPFRLIFAWRCTANGTVDITFDTDGVAFHSYSTSNYDEGRKIVADANNNYYIMGATYNSNLGYDYCLLKLKNNGSTDNTFGLNGFKLYDLDGTKDDEYILNGAVLPNGNFLLTGNQGSGDTVYFAMLSVKPDGSPDNNFAPNGLYKNIFQTNNNSSSGGLAISDDGKIYLSGYTRTCTGGTCGPLYLALARYNGGAAPASIDNSFNTTAIDIYPNPTNNVLNINSPLAGTINMYNTNGQLVFNNLINDGKQAFNTQALPKGVYYVSIILANQTSFTKTIVVE